MYFEQFYLGCLAHASYVIASEGIAAVVDPQRDIDLYLEEAARNGFHIEHVVETHLHADFVSGHRELAARTGARIYVGARGGATFPHIAVREGLELSFGRCRLRFLETPGHTVESISVLVADLDAGQEPFAVLTGDTLFIGDVGRPDLSGDFSPQELASMLYDSLHGKLLTLPDSVKVFPAHGAGSLCGKQISSERSSTIGMQRLTNYACRPMPREEFIGLVTADLPPRPEYFARDVELNRAGAMPLSDLPPLAALSPGEVAARQLGDTLVLDTRPPIQFGVAHVPGSVHVPLSGEYAAWAGAILGLDEELILVAEDVKALEESRIRLARVGIERVVGYLEEGILSWIRAGYPLEQVPQVTVAELPFLKVLGAGPVAETELTGFQILDVRRPAEWEEGCLPGAIKSSLHRLTGRVEGLDKERPVLINCRIGYRSSIAASLLKRAGFSLVANLAGGYEAWKAVHLPAARVAHTT